MNYFDLKDHSSESLPPERTSIHVPIKQLYERFRRYVDYLVIGQMTELWLCLLCQHLSCNHVTDTRIYAPGNRSQRIIAVKRKHA